MDDLKKYLQQHPGEMDIDMPGEKVWQHIRSKTVKKPAPGIVRMMTGFVAAACLLAAIFFAARLLPGKTPAALPVTAAAPPLQVPPVDMIDSFPETAITATTGDTPKPAKKQPINERYVLMEGLSENYDKLVSYQLNNIRSTPVYAETPGYFGDFRIRLRQIDADEEMIRKNIQHNGINDLLLDQLINVYQQKLDVLKSLQSEINKMNNKVKQQYGLPDSLSRFYLNI